VMGNSHDLYPESTGALRCSVCWEWITDLISYIVDNRILCPKCYRELSGLPLLPGAETFYGSGFPRKGGAWLTVEQLKALDTWHGTDGIEIGLCPVCAGKGHHKEGCWLAEKIRQAEGGI